MSDRKSIWTPNALDTLRSALGTWYHEHARPLPWRTQPSLYRTVVSEFMCQQTQIDTVLPYFERWMNQFPDFIALASAPESSVLRAWEGLGYYNRARNLHKLAREITTRTQLPSTPDEWKELPGIGPYTAAAISSINDRFPAAVVDGNVIRVITRITADATPFKGNSEAAKIIQPLADLLLDRNAPGDHNQAMMELGATLCLKARPLCLLCPLKTWCAGTSSGEPERFPVVVRRTSEKITQARIFLISNGQLLLERAPAGAKRLANLAELPRAELFPEETRGRLLATRQRGISHQRITEQIYEGVATDHTRTPTQSCGLFWQPLATLDAITLSGPHRRWINELITASRLPIGFGQNRENAQPRQVKGVG